MKFNVKVFITHYGGMHGTSFYAERVTHKQKWEGDITLLAETLHKDIINAFSKPNREKITFINYCIEMRTIELYFSPEVVNDRMVGDRDETDNIILETVKKTMETYYGRKR